MTNFWIAMGGGMVGVLIILAIRSLAKKFINVDWDAVNMDHSGKVEDRKTRL